MFKLKLKDFEGPFDLLLYFIKRDELDIYDIPISKITEEFLDYIKLLNQLDLEVASEFILMAATLLQIKAEMLLRTDDESDELLDGMEDPRLPLVEQLIEYKKFKEASLDLMHKSQENKNHFYRKNYDAEIQNFEQNADYKNSSLFSLINAINTILKRRNVAEEKFHQVTLFPISIEDKKKEIIEFLNRKTRLSFINFISNYSKIEIIVTFLAILELGRNNQISLFQENQLDDIIISLKLNLN
jgi:segregation and condensation protein A